MEIKYHNTAGTILTRENKDKIEVLLIYRYWKENDTQAWVFPKGHVEDGESIEQTALRETIEETGYRDIKLLEFLKTITIEFDWYDGFRHNKTIHFYHSILLSNIKGRRELSEGEKKTVFKQKWFEIHEARKKLTYDSDKSVLDILINNYDNKGNN